jgi:hypothetical protein
MKKFTGNLSQEKLQTISQSLCEVIARIGKPFQWIQSAVTDDKACCVHVADNEYVDRKNARLCKVPIIRIAEIKAVIDPLTSNRW